MMSKGMEMIFFRLLWLVNGENGGCVGGGCDVGGI